MANYALRIGDTPEPEWRAAMTVADRIYNVSSTLPGTTAGLVPNPVPSHYINNSESPNFGCGTEIIGGYACGTLLKSEGVYGTMLYGTGGHTTLANQVLGLPLSNDAPAFIWWRQPEFQTSDTAGANLYYDPTAAAGYSIDRTIPTNSIPGTVGNATTPSTTQFTPSALAPYAAAPAPFTAGVDVLKLRTLRFEDDTTTVVLRGVSAVVSANGAGSLPLITLASALPAAPASGDTFKFGAEDAGRWDRGFPVAFSGWIWPRKMTTGQMGNNAPHGYRYADNCFVPASVTGSDPIWLVGAPRPQGPFALGERPSGVSLADWFHADSLYSPSGRRKWPFHALNLRTGAWSIIGNFPDVDTSVFQGSVFALDEASKRVYLSFDNTQPCTMYLDFTDGLGAVSISGVTAASVSGSHGRYVNCVGALTAGHPTKLLWYWPDAGANDGGLFIQDVLAGTTAFVDLTAAGLDLIKTNEKLGTCYIQGRNQLFFIQPLNVSDPSAGFEYFLVNVPSGDYTDAANYTVTRHSLTVDSSVTTMDAAANLAEFYGKTQVIEELDDVCLIPFSRGYMLGFRLS